MEQHIITKPTVVMPPPTVWHSPFLFRKMKKPVLLQAAFQAGCWGTIVREKNEKGDWIYTYRGDNVRFCRYRPGEKCTLCGRRFSIRAGDEIKE